MPRSIRFFIHNRWNRAACEGETGTVIGFSGEQTGYEADLTQTIALAERWRSPGLPGAYISADLGAGYRLGAVCLVKCNLSRVGLFRVQVGNTSDFSTNLYDSGWGTRRRYYSDAEIIAAHTSEFFTAGLPISDMQKRIQRQVIVVAFPAEVTARYIRIDFDDVTNPDGFMELSYVYAGIVLEPSNDLLYGWKMQREDFVRDGQAACGQYWSASVYNKTLITLQMAPQRESDLTGYWMLMEALVSINKEFIVSLIERTDSLHYTTTVYGRWSVVPTNTAIAFQSYSIPMAVEEIID